MYRASWGTKPLRGHIKFGKAKLGTPRASERAVLRLEGGDQVVRFERLRYLERRPFAYELVRIPERRFPNLMLHCPVADDLQELAQISGIVVARAEGKVRALAVPSVVATALCIAERAGPRESDNWLSLARLWERTSTDDEVNTQSLQR